MRGVPNLRFGRDEIASFSFNNRRYRHVPINGMMQVAFKNPRFPRKRSPTTPSLFSKDCAGMGAGKADSLLWTSYTMVDSATPGDQGLDSWEVYCTGGVTSSQLNLNLASAEIRVLNDAYRLDGVTCEEDPIGMIQTHTQNSRIYRAHISDQFGIRCFLHQIFTPAQCGCSYIAWRGNSMATAYWGR